MVGRAGRAWVKPAAWRGAVILSTALTVLLVIAAPASAHGRGSDATNWDSRITATPDPEAVQWAVHGGDELLEVSSSEHEVVVLGYSGEPYVRVGPQGVFENRSSPATYLNQDRYRTELPAGVDADPDAEPRWEQVSSGHSFAWHDHRIHSMTPSALPAQVADDPERQQLVQEWTVPVRVDGQSAAVQGELHWVPGTSPWPWLAAGVLVALPALAGVAASAERPARLARPAAAVLAAVALANSLHVVDDVAAMPLPLSTMLLAAGQTAAFLLIALLGAGKAWRGGDGAFPALAVGSAAILVGQGLLYLPVLSASQITSVFLDPVGRMLVATSIGQALTVGAVAVIGTRRMVPSDRDAVDHAPTPA